MLGVSFDKNNVCTAITPAILGYNIVDNQDYIVGFVISMAWLYWSLDLEYYYYE